MQTSQKTNLERSTLEAIPVLESYWLDVLPSIHQDVRPRKFTAKCSNNTNCPFFDTTVYMSTEEFI